MKKDTWINHPTKKQLLLVIITWFIGSSLLVLSVTDLFTESFFQKEYIMMYFILIGSSYTTFKVFVNYRKNLLA